MSTTVQLEGIEAVVTAYASRKIPGFAILQGRNLNFSYDGDSLEEGIAELEQWLTAIQKSKATYTIKFIKHSDIKGEIRANTPDVGALNFRLNLDPIGGNAATMGAVPYYLEKRIEELEKRNNQLTEIINDRDMMEVESEGEQNNIIGTIKQLAEIPGFNNLVAGLIGLITRGAAAAPAATIGNVPVTNNENFTAMQSTEEITQPEIERAAIAYTHIRTAVPDALELLEKLAMKAQENPEGLKKQIGLIKSFI